MSKIFKVYNGSQTKTKADCSAFLLLPLTDFLLLFSAYSRNCPDQFHGINKCLSSADFQLQGFFHKTKGETGLVRQDGCVVYLFAVHLGGLIHYSSQ